MLKLLVLCCIGAAFARTPLGSPPAWTKTEELFVGYNKDYPPWGWPGGQEQLDVQVGIQVLGVKVVTAKNTVEVPCWFRRRWHEPRLAYNGTEFFGAANWKPFAARGAFSVSPDKVWTPRLTVTNSMRNPFEDFVETTEVTISQEGEHAGGNMYHSAPGNILVSCQFDMKLFPFDTQVCMIDVESWAFDRSQIHLVPMPGSAQLLGDVQMFEDFTITAINFTSAVPAYPSAGAAKWSKEVISMTLVRSPGMYITYAIAPLFLMVILASLSAWIEISADESQGMDSDRIAYCATILLTEMATMLFFNDKRPMSGHDTWLDNYQCTCIILTVIPLMETFAVLYLMHHRDQISDMYHKVCGGRNDGQEESDDDSEITPLKVAGSKSWHEMKSWHETPGLVVDTYFRNIYPFVVVCALGHLYHKVRDSFCITTDTSRSMALMGALTVSIECTLVFVALLFIIDRLRSLWASHC